MPKEMTICFCTTAQLVNKANGNFCISIDANIASRTISVAFVKAIQSDIKGGVILYRLILNQAFITKKDPFHIVCLYYHLNQHW